VVSGWDQWERDHQYADDDRDLAPTWEDSRPLGERCPRCNATKDQDNAVCDDCGDVVGCAYCGGTKEIPDPSHPITSGYEGFLFAGPQMMVACTECCT
jgi:hypothetical protein